MQIEQNFTTHEQAKLLIAKGFNNGNVCIPEQWQVIKWLLTNYKIWVKPNWYFEKEVIKWCVSIDTPGVLSEFVYLKNFDSPEDACSAAFDYILNEHPKLK